MIYDYDSITLSQFQLPPVEAPAQIDANNFSAALFDAQQISSMETALKRPLALALPGDEITDRKFEPANTHSLLQESLIHEPFDLMHSTQK